MHELCFISRVRNFTVPVTNCPSFPRSAPVIGKQGSFRKIHTTMTLPTKSKYLECQQSKRRYEFNIFGRVRNLLILETTGRLAQW